jgi:arylsulfatase
VEQQITALQRLGGLEALGSPKTDNMYHAGWAGSTPFKGTRLLASYFGGTRNPKVISWPKRIRPDGVICSQFHRVIDIAPTIYEILGIILPKVVNGHVLIPIDGTSLVYTFDDGTAPTRKKVQFLDNNGSRAIFRDGWPACTFGPFIPWNTPLSMRRIANWDSATDEWELDNLAEDFSRADNLAVRMPDKLEQQKVTL